LILYIFHNYIWNVIINKNTTNFIKPNNIPYKIKKIIQIFKKSNLLNQN
jgi:hypothetical protein